MWIYDVPSYLHQRSAADVGSGGNTNNEQFAFGAANYHHLTHQDPSSAGNPTNYTHGYSNGGDRHNFERISTPGAGRCNGVGFMDNGTGNPA